jgi:hypothetical protein
MRRCLRFPRLLLLIALAGLAPCRDQAPATVARLGAYGWFFRHVLGTDNFALYVPPEPVHPLSRSAAATEFGLTPSELTLVRRIAADLQAEDQQIGKQAQELYAAGKTSGSPELRDVTARGSKILLEHVDRMAAALGSDRFAKIDAAIQERFRSNPARIQGPSVIVLESNGKSTEARCADTANNSIGLPVIDGNGGKQYYQWQNVSRVDVVNGQLTINLKNNPKVIGVHFPDGGFLTCETKPGRRVNIPFSNIKRITVREPPQTRPPAWGPSGRGPLRLSHTGRG